MINILTFVTQHLADLDFSFCGVECCEHELNLDLWNTLALFKYKSLLIGFIKVRKKVIRPSIDTLTLYVFSTLSIYLTTN